MEKPCYSYNNFMLYSYELIINFQSLILPVPPCCNYAGPELESTKMSPKYFSLRNMNDLDTPEGLFESRSRSVSACNSGGSQDCIDKRELPLQTLNIRREVDETFMAAIIEKHRKRRRINSMLLVAPKTRVTTGADFGRSHNDIRHQVAVRYSMRCKVRSILTRVY